MDIVFTKMHGIGNDYLYINAIEQPLPEEALAGLARAMSDRHTGVGADGIILILPPDSDEAEFRMRMFNADGSEGEMCGNGIRCFAKYVYDHGLTDKAVIRVQTLAGIIVPELVFDGNRAAGARVDMGRPRFRRSEIPMLGPSGDRATRERIRVLDRDFEMTCLSMGNPHCVIPVEDVGAIDVQRYGPVLERDRLFPNRTNVEFIQVLNDRELAMRVWERGTGITLACGTGACASVVAAHTLGLAGRRVTVHLLGGDLDIEWAPDDRVYMTGPAATICEGRYYFE